MRCGVFFENYRGEEQLWDSPTARAWIAAFIAVVALLPLWGSDYVVAMACIVGIHLIATMGLNITTGSAGLISLSQAAFMGVGCYAVSWFAKWGIPFWLALPLAGALAAAIGMLVGLPSLRVKGMYFAIATLAAHFVLGFLFREWTPVTGGPRGVTILPASFFGIQLTGDRRMFYPIFVCAVLLGLAAANLGRSYVGRAFVAVRDRDISAEILGVNLLRTKVLAFMLGAFYAGVAGGLLGYFYGAITSEYFTFGLSVFYVAAIIVGGLGRVLGSVLGAVFMTFVPESLRLLSSALSGSMPSLASHLLPMGQIVFGVLIIGFLVFEPHGLAQIWARVRRTFHLWPFRT
ncbi:branched-chain amino acid ABC transporter permease [Caenimonas sp. SL110]|uniref:branched-chain amino acid ABC transporter permease n=1 Tax=Caenimonas sp. SL110 TaxID=1450524 RepID=UPI00065374D2|nr:branched-chain amino acid ABC transporter permease [Caenimonas sp. SL110]